MGKEIIYFCKILKTNISKMNVMISPQKSGRIAWRNGRNGSRMAWMIVNQVQNRQNQRKNIRYSVCHPLVSCKPHAKPPCTSLPCICLCVHVWFSCVVFVVFTKPLHGRNGQNFRSDLCTASGTPLKTCSNATA